MNKRIPTNLITGFLGSGKTTALLSILQRKPAQEKWAILVNEFGEVGIDGAILAGRGADAPSKGNQDVEIRQIAGGCMCCVAELPMKVALNALISKAKPDRLLIETTGLGHPQALVDTLTDSVYGALLDLRAIICLLDPRKLHEARYMQHAIFRDQLNIADVIVANKTDLCSADDRLVFEKFISTLQPPKQISSWAVQGQLALDWLDLNRTARGMVTATTAKKINLLQLPAAAPLPVSLQAGEAFTRREHNGDGYFSCGWLFSETIRFDYQALRKLLATLKIARLKGLVHTERGGYVFNSADGILSFDPSAVSHNAIEMIHDQAVDWQTIEQQLLAACSQPN